MKRLSLIQKSPPLRRVGASALAALTMLGTVTRVWALADFEVAGPGHWRFDDCLNTSTTLIDSSANQAIAQKSAIPKPGSTVPTITCSNLGAGDRSLPGHKSVVFANGATIIASKTTGFEALNNSFYIAAWIKPSNNTQGTIVTKELNGGGNAWTLSLSNPADKRIDPSKLVFTMWLKPTSGSTPVAVSLVSTSVIPVGVWTHVAASYEYTPTTPTAGSGNATVKLWVNGTAQRQITETRSIADKTGRIRMGSTATQSNGYAGAMDEVMIRPTSSTAGSSRIAGLCVQKFGASWASTLPPNNTSIAPGSPVLPGTAINYDITITNNDYEPTSLAAGACKAMRTVNIDPLQTEYGFSWKMRSGAISSANISRQGSAVFRLTAKSDANDNIADQSILNQADSGRHWLAYRLSDSTATLAEGSVTYILEERSGCSVKTRREILITDPSVVDDPLRTAPGGAWSFKKLMTDAAPTGANVADFVEDLMTQVYSATTRNSFQVPFLQRTKDTVLAAWPRLTDGKLDLDRAPFRLSAIVSRLDKRDLRSSYLPNRIAGEGRFVFSFTGTGGTTHDFTLILEYGLPGTTVADVNTWAQRWHNLGSIKFDEKVDATDPASDLIYNKALQVVTDLFATRGKAPNRINGSALLQLRTNDYFENLQLSQKWHLRHFELGPPRGFFLLAPVAQTPDASFQNPEASIDNLATVRIGRFINANRDAVMEESHVVPLTFNDGGTSYPMQGASSVNTDSVWNAYGVTGSIMASPSDLRFHFARATCSGCHSRETQAPEVASTAGVGTSFAHVKTRYAGTASELSPFMLGTDTKDPTDVVTYRTQGDLLCRTNDLEMFVCNNGGGGFPVLPLPSEKHCNPPLH